MMSGHDIADLVMNYFMERFTIPYFPKSVNFCCTADAFMQAYGSILTSIFENRNTYFADFGEDPELRYRNMITLHVSLKKIFSTMPNLNYFGTHEQPRILIRTCAIMAVSVAFFHIAGVLCAIDKGFLYIASAADYCIIRSSSLRNQPLVTFSSDYLASNPDPHHPPPFYGSLNPIFFPQVLQMQMPMAMPPVIEPTVPLLQLPPLPQGAVSVTVPVPAASPTPSGSSSEGRSRRGRAETKKVLFYQKTL